jgi:hypothetical protein
MFGVAVAGHLTSQSVSQDGVTLVRRFLSEEVGRGSKSKRKLAAQKTRKSAAAFVRIGLQLEQTQYV